MDFPANSMEMQNSPNQAKGKQKRSGLYSALLERPKPAQAKNQRQPKSQSSFCYLLSLVCRLTSPKYHSPPNQKSDAQKKLFLKKAKFPLQTVTFSKTQRTDKVMAGEWDDATLIQQIRSGDERLINHAVKEIFLTGGGFVALIVRKNGGTEEDQQEVLDDATMELVQKVQSHYYLPEKTGLEPFFHMIVRSRWNDKLRKKYRHNDHEAFPGEDFFSSQHKDEKPIDEQLSDSESAEKMARMLEKLTPECRELLKKYWYDRVPINVLAQQLNVTEDALKQRHARCKDKLRKLLGEDPRKS